MHNITPDKVLFCFREYDLESLDLAAYYKYYRGLPIANLIALPCSTDRIITEAQYHTQIEGPILAALEELDRHDRGSEVESLGSGGGGGGSSPIEHEIWVIILGYHVPNFYTTVDGATIPIASRIQRIRQPYTGKVHNHTYNREIFQFFTSEDIDYFYITAVLDGPDYASVKAMMEAAMRVSNEDVITGKFFLDPYGLRETDEQLAYRDELVDFYYSYLPYLQLQPDITVETTLDPSFRSVIQDSFYWGWYTPHCPKRIFANQSQKRVFLYNADNSSAANIRSSGTTDSVSWCNPALATSPAYAATAGATADPGIDAYLRPRPFFRALHMGATLGEAFMSASKYLDWRVILIGDPLLTVNFPGPVPPDPYGPASLPPKGNTPSLVNGNLMLSDQVVAVVKERIEESIAYRQRTSKIIESTAQRVIDSGDEDENVYLLEPLLRWQDAMNEIKTKKRFVRTVTKWYSFVTESSRSTLNEWFKNNCQRTTTDFSSLISGNTKEVVESDYIYPSDEFWNLAFAYVHPIKTLEQVHFQIQVLDYTDGSVILDINTLSSMDGWEYERLANTFVQMTDGFPSDLSGLRIRYSAVEANYLPSLEMYNIRWRALHEDGSAITDYYLLESPLLIKGSTWEGDIVTSPDDTVVFYANSFGLALDAGTRAYDSFSGVIDMLTNIETATMNVYNLTSFQENKGYQPLQRRKELTAAVRDLLVYLHFAAYDRNYYVAAFDGLYTYIRKAYDTTIDNYLTDNGLKVNSAFAIVSESLGVPISPGNVGT